MSEQRAGRLASWRIANIARELASQKPNLVDYSLQMLDASPWLLADGQPLVDLNEATIDWLYDDLGRWVVIDTERLRGLESVYLLLPETPWKEIIEEAGIDFY